MKLFFISDIHGSIDDLEWAIKKFTEEKAEYLVILGDLLYHGPRNPLPQNYAPKKVAELLNSYKEKIICIRGNCDSEVDQMLIKFPILSDFSQIFADNKRFFLTHGHIYNPNNIPNLNSGDILCYGHTHIPLIEKNSNIIIFNPGSITFPKEGNEKSYGIYNDNSLKVFSENGQIIKEYNL